MSNSKKVLITGAAGLVGSILRQHWGDRHRLRLTDVRPVEDLSSHEQFVQTDITDYQQMLAACSGMDTVVHLAADPSMNAEFYDTLLPLNVIGAYNAFEAAREAGCRRLVFASSINAVLGYEGEDVQWDAPVFPQNVYGATKCWGEAVARVYADQHDLSCICVRLGSPRFNQGGDWDPEKRNGSLSARDCAQLFACCVEAAGVDFAIVNGISNHRHSWMDLEISRSVLGYEPQDGTTFPRTTGKD
ncbi:MAG TPA: NAD(P)-dependent oxidoreductase [Candidatus Latescibacteria bacterium]|jgi:nucleoside-diphosphate-sugar epimerase|nr:epimerase [Gemmatimonadaceae bacterium]MDP6018361.1 NAD(P)-dependent oxidoreductase [Candidatus Latescibacterota bacterium]HJP30654.1 NAD(P)-dependent oxidoreductase [Candidatus Latescibacterota bacterium]